MRSIFAIAAALTALALAGCAGQTPAITGAAIKADAQVAVVSFCTTGLPAAQPLVGDLNAQLQADYATVSRACTAIGNGQSVNVVTVASAALALYDGLRVTYPKAFTALAGRDIVALRRIDPASLRGLR